MTNPGTPGRPTLVMNVVHKVIEDGIRIAIGLLAMAAGFWTVAYEMKHPPIAPATRGVFDIIVLVAGIVFAVLGFLMQPYVFEQTQRIIVLVFPGGVDVPVLGHLFRRKDDKQPPATPPT